MRRPILALIALLLLISAPAVAASPQQWTGQYAGTAEPRTTIAITAAGWQDITNLAGTSARPFAPFDAAHQTGIGIFLGRRNTGGYSVKIVSMAPRDDKFVVTVDEVTPDMNAIGTQVQTSPWLILLIDKPELPVAVEPRFHAN
jgi:hypothetical protein